MNLLASWNSKKEKSEIILIKVINRKTGVSMLDAAAASAYDTEMNMWTWRQKSSVGWMFAPPSPPPHQILSIRDHSAWCAKRRVEMHMHVSEILRRGRKWDWGYNNVDFPPSAFFKSSKHIFHEATQLLAAGFFLSFLLLLGSSKVRLARAETDGRSALKRESTH